MAFAPDGRLYTCSGEDGTVAAALIDPSTNGTGFRPLGYPL